MSTHAASYTIFFFGNTISAFGTSAVAPLWAGLAALLNQTLGNRVGFLNPVLYRNTAAFRDIITGNNSLRRGRGLGRVHRVRKSQRSLAGCSHEAGARKTRQS